jgi:hypothetical protein
MPLLRVDASLTYQVTTYLAFNFLQGQGSNADDHEYNTGKMEVLCLSIAFNHREQESTDKYDL